LLELALKGLQAERTKIDDEIVQIRAQLNQATPTTRSAAAVSSTAAPAEKRRRMSAAAKRNISEAMKRRYAAMRQAGKKPA
jgi:hypothetical protein